MNTIPIPLPKGSTIRGQLQDRYDLADLDQDILEVGLPNGLTIDVGWYPQYDPDGQFRIVVFRDYWPNHVRRPIFATTPFEVAEVLRNLAADLLRPVVQASRASDTETRFRMPAAGVPRFAAV